MMQTKDEIQAVLDALNDDYREAVASYEANETLANFNKMCQAAEVVRDAEEYFLSMTGGGQ